MESTTKAASEKFENLQNSYEPALMDHFLIT